MARKFNPSNKDAVESEERKSFYDLHALLKWFAIGKGMTVADMGCGTGYCTVPLAALVGEEGAVFACDLSEEVLDVLRNKIDRWNIENIIPLRSEENHFPLNNNSLDFILLSLIFHELQSPADFLSEVKRVLKKEGRIGIVDWDRSDNPHKKDPGPPQQERISLENVKKILLENDLGIAREKKLGNWHYAILSGKNEELIREKIVKVGEKMVSELLCLSEKEMRSASLAERFNAVKAETVVEILNEFCTKASEKKGPYVEIMNNCIDMEKMREVLGLEKMSNIYVAAKTLGYDNVVRLLMNPPPKGKKYSEFDFVEGQVTHDITLGEKRSLAKGIDKDTLDRIIYDEDPIVIKNLLSNPRITERDVLKIASKRPIKPEILKVIFESKKWLSRYVVKRALLLNPFTPTGIALGLVNFMHYKDLKLIGSSKYLHHELQDSARDLLEKNY
ncbi:MAG: class I SAM-dependent methyltransferase [Deltaproteobacteria bacterium]|nr:class I SAM-dependent methyltransferase [Deltaproteobacteria bacterium]